jgi:hypothetical protein
MLRAVTPGQVRRGQWALGAEAVKEIQGAGRSPADERQKSELLARLAADHADVDPAVLAGVLEAVWQRTGEYRIQQFRVILAERQVRASLRRRSDEEPAQQAAS